jgi:hypothetical protein
VAGAVAAGQLAPVAHGARGGRRLAWVGSRRAGVGPARGLPLAEAGHRPRRAGDLAGAPDRHPVRCLAAAAPARRGGAARTVRAGAVPLGERHLRRLLGAHGCARRAIPRRPARPAACRGRRCRHRPVTRACRVHRGGRRRRLRAAPRRRFLVLASPARPLAAHHSCLRLQPGRAAAGAARVLPERSQPRVSAGVPRLVRRRLRDDRARPGDSPGAHRLGRPARAAGGAVDAHPGGFRRDAHGDQPVRRRGRGRPACGAARPSTPHPRVHPPRRHRADRVPGLGLRPGPGRRARRARRDAALRLRHDGRPAAGRRRHAVPDSAARDLPRSGDGAAHDDGLARRGAGCLSGRLHARAAQRPGRQGGPAGGIAHVVSDGGDRPRRPLRLVGASPRSRRAARRVHLRRHVSLSRARSRHRPVSNARPAAGDRQSLLLDGPDVAGQGAAAHADPDDDQRLLRQAGAALDDGLSRRRDPRRGSALSPRGAGVEAGGGGPRRGEVPGDIPGGLAAAPRGRGAEALRPGRVAYPARKAPDAGARLLDRGGLGQLLLLLERPAAAEQALRLPAPRRRRPRRPAGAGAGHSRRPSTHQAVSAGGVPARARLARSGPLDRRGAGGGRRSPRSSANEPYRATGESS